MNWFKRHLNWTVVLITIGSNVVSYYLVDLFFRFSNISPWGPKYSPETIEVLLPPFSSFYLDLQFILADIIVIIGFSWVLVKKNRHWVYLLYFFAFLIFDFLTFLSYMVHMQDWLSNLSYGLRFVTVSLWIAGWIILLALKNKSHSIPNKSGSP